MLRFFDLLLLILISTLIFPIFLFVFLLALFFLLISCGSFIEPILKKSDEFKLTEFQGKKVSFSISFILIGVYLANKK